MTFTSILTGLLLAVAGFFITAKSDWFTNNFGRIAWFEAHLGSAGGTRLFYKLLGIVVILGGFMYATGMLQAMVAAFFAPITRGLR